VLIGGNYLGGPVEGKPSFRYSLGLGAEIYDPVAESWTATGEIPRRAAYTPDPYPSLVALPDGRARLTGGEVGLSTSRAQNGDYRTSSLVLALDPRTLLWTELPRMHEARGYHAAIGLRTGGALVAGGQFWRRGTGECRSELPANTAECLGGEEPRTSVELLDAGGEAWSQPASHPGWTVSREAPQAIELTDRRILLTVSNAPESRSPFVVFDPANASWVDGEPLKTERSRYTLTRLRDGRVLAVGGSERRRMGFLKQIRAGVAFDVVVSPYEVSTSSAVEFLILP
jgi:hypothetical protein